MPPTKDIDVERPGPPVAPAPVQVGGGGGVGGGREFTDEELVQRLREGEAAAGETLCRRYHLPLYRYLQRIMRSDHAAEELFQQTWLSVLEHLDRFDPGGGSGGGGGGGGGGGFKAWLFRIATNKANDHWRSKGRERAAKDGLRLVTDQEVDAAEVRLGGTEQTIKLREAIEKLPGPQRQVLMLRYYSGMKFVEIARTLGCPLNTALGRMHKAVLKLRTVMEAEEKGGRVGGGGRGDES